MGVTHKIKQEIIGFLLREKEQDPGLSCRKLSDLVKKEFGVDLSKSSISNILKESNLNSPVGRRSANVRTKAFKIPEEKKKELFPQPHEKPTPAPPKPQKRESEQKINLQKEIEALLKEPSLSSPHQEVESAACSEEQIDGAGTIFLKAAQDEIFGGSILGALLARHCRAEGLKDHAALGDVLTFMKAFGLNRIEELAGYRGQGLWSLNQLKEPLEMRTIEDFIKKAIDARGLSLSFAVELPQLLTKGAYVKLRLEDGTELIIDAKGSCLWPGNVQSDLALPMSKITQNIVDQYINNVQSVVLCADLGVRDFSAQFYDLVLAFENLPGKRIEQVVIFDRTDMEIAAFQPIFNKKRFFVVGLWPWQERFKQFVESENVAKIESLARDLPGENIFFQEVVISLDRRHLNSQTEGPRSGAENLKVRGFLLRENIGTDPFVVVLTNAMQEDLSSQEVILSYCDRWPNFSGGPTLRTIKREATAYSQAASEKEGGHSPASPLGRAEQPRFDEKTIASYFKTNTYDVLTVGQEILEHLHRYCQSEYFSSALAGFDLGLATENIYSLPGNIVFFEKGCAVTLDVGGRPSALQKEIAEAVINFNESGFNNSRKNNIILKVLN